MKTTDTFEADAGSFLGRVPGSPPMHSDTLIPLLHKAYASEMETVQNYLANSVWIEGLRGKELGEVLGADVAEELSHATRIAQRMKQLGVCPPGSLSLARDQLALQPNADAGNLGHVISGALSAERDAIALYRLIIKACGTEDPVTADLAVQILAEEERHRCLLEGFMNGMEEQRTHAQAQVQESEKSSKTTHHA